ncbi:MAG: TOBE domain-containing protein, partial [Marivivens sp.]|nr:TOBE domain-containing protein [Marivivens sp.]
TGSDTLIDVVLADHHFRARMDGQARVAVGDKLTLGIDPARASLFDKTTELRL